LQANRKERVAVAASLQSFGQVAVLLIIILAVAVVGIACAGRVSSALCNMRDEHGAAGSCGATSRPHKPSFYSRFTFLHRPAYSITNAAGDGAKEGVMIREAHCGIGI